MLIFYICTYAFFFFFWCRLQLETEKGRERVIEYSNKEAVLTASLTSQAEKAALQMQSLDTELLSLRDELEMVKSQRQQVEKSQEEGARAAEEARRALESLTASSVESTEQLSAAKASVVSLEKQLASEQQQQAALRLRLDE